MSKAAAIIALYALAFVAIGAAVRIAPNMTWPANGEEMTAAASLLIGMAAKLAGHIVLFRR